jgi:hypothetical protein
VGTAFAKFVDDKVKACQDKCREAGAYTLHLSCSMLAHFVGYVGCMIFPQSIRQGDTRRCDQND